MDVGSPVRLYDEMDEWFSEGEIVAISGDVIDVDFYDWVQRYDASDLTLRIIFYSDILIAKRGAGETISDFR